ncbi:MAG: heavy metal sensor histidine kinase [candidate division Zixibacteria bacterium]|nr:heavy metal sensor histidine kinase [candidate division Zixibacteria bacterium]
MSLKEGPKFYKRTDFKITLWYVFSFVITILIVFFFMYVRLKHHLIKEVDRLLEDESREFAAEISENRMNIHEAMRDYEKDVFARKASPIHARVLKADGTIIVASKNFAEVAHPLDYEKLGGTVIGDKYAETVQLPGRSTPFRLFTVHLRLNGEFDYVVQIGTRMSSMRKTLSNFRHNMLTAIPIMLVFGTLGGWLLARRSLSPIAQITETARRITASNLGDRLKPRQSNDELDHLIKTLNQMISRLEESFERVSQFTADASHELRTPISAMKGEAELLLSKPRSIGEYRRVLSNHLEKLDFLNRMINDLILLSKFDTNEAGLQMAPIELNELLANLRELLGVLAEQKDIEFSLGVIKEAHVLGDRTRLQQLFTNLIDNAIKFTPAGGRVDMSLENNEGIAKVSISDTGIGIPEGEFEHIFERFYRVDKSRARVSGGTGLGLSICQWIAKAHHGKIEVESELGKGSQFTVSLPLLSDK